MWKLYPLSSFLKLSFYRRETLNNEKTKSESFITASRDGHLRNLSASVCFCFFQYNRISQDDLLRGDHPCCPRWCFSGVAWGPVDISAPPCPSHHTATASETPSLPTLVYLVILSVQVAPVLPPDSSSALSAQDGSASFPHQWELSNFSTGRRNRGPLLVTRFCNLLSVRIRWLRLEL